MVPMNSLSMVFTEMPASGMLRKGRLELLLNLRPQHNYGAEMVPFPPLKSFHLQATDEISSALHQCGI